MSKVKLEIEVEPAQIEALNIFLGGKNTCLEFEISEHIESLYKKNCSGLYRCEQRKQEKRKEVRSNLKTTQGPYWVLKTKQDKGVEPSSMFYSFYITRQSRVNKRFLSVTKLQYQWF